jgi:hypothetical protein
MDNWQWTVQHLFAFASELRCKDAYARQKLNTFLQRACLRRTELMASSELGEDGREGFRIYVISVYGIEDQYFEFVRKNDGTYAFRSTVTHPMLTFEAVFDYEHMNRETKRFLEYDYDRAIGQLLV